MQMAFLENRHEARAFAFSLGVLVFSVLAIASFALFGGGVLFYVFAVLAIAVGFYMAWHLSNAPAAASEAKPSDKAPKSAKRRARKR